MSRIERVETVPYALPFREPYVTARGAIERREMVLLRLGVGDGVEGLGEAVPLALRGGAGPGEVRDQLEAAGARLVGLELGGDGGRPIELAIATVLELARPRKLAPPALTALECALFDLAARLEGQPLWRALGAERAGPVRCNATLVAGTPEAVAEQARTWAGAGFASFKLKAGAGGDDPASVAAVRESVGPEARIRLDANEAWSPREAVTILRELEPLGIELCEQPVRGLRAMARVARDVAVPLAADEAVASEADAHRAVARRACAYATAKLAKVGGIGGASAIAKVIPTYLSSALDGPVGIAAAAHCAQLLPDPGLAHGLATQRLFAAWPAVAGCELEGDELRLPDRPGLGVELDEGALDALRTG